MKKAIYLAAAAVLLSAAPAHADGRGTAGPVSIGVIGDKLKVKEVRAIMDGHEAGARARVSLWQHGKRVSSIRSWTFTDSGETAGYKYESTTWKLHSRAFPNNSRLCVEFSGHTNRACATIHS